MPQPPAIGTPDHEMEFVSRDPVSPPPLRTPHSALRTSNSPSEIRNPKSEIPHLVLGVDPGLNRTGYAILERGARKPVLREAGIIRSTQKTSLSERVLEIGMGLREVCQQYKPDVMAIEQVFSTGRFPKTALLMAHARGAILYAAAECRVQVVHYTPRQIKKLLTGSGKAGKEQVQRAIAGELRLDRVLEPHDVSDAAAVAICHYYASRLPAALE